MISNSSPFPQDELKKYQVIKAKMDGKNIETKNERPRIGFNSNRDNN